MSGDRPDRFLKIGDVTARTALSRSYIYRLIKRGEFPEPRKLGAKCSRWVESEVTAWMDQTG